MAESPAGPGEQIPEGVPQEPDQRALFDQLKREFTPERLQEVEEQFRRLVSGEEATVPFEELIRELEEIHRQGTSHRK
jgi:hypothetical protein